MQRSSGALRNLKPLVSAIDARIARPATKVAESFYLSPEWRQLVGDLIASRGRRCEDCGATQGKDGSPVRLIGDHVRERRDGGAPLDPENVRLLCGGCHNRKTAHARVKRMASVPDVNCVPS